MLQLAVQACSPKAHPAVCSSRFAPGWPQASTAACGDSLHQAVYTDLAWPKHRKSASCGCAGLTNAFWMRPGTVMMQLLPYGWQLPTGQLIRTGLSRDMSLALNGTYLQVCSSVSPDLVMRLHVAISAAGTAMWVRLGMARGTDAPIGCRSQLCCCSH